MRVSRLRMQMLAAMFAAVIAVCAQVAIPIPFSPVPFTGQTLAVALTATVLGARYGTLAMLIYTLLGAVGVRVFSEFQGGLHVLVGPTGGFIFGFIVAAYVIGKMMELGARFDGMGKAKTTGMTGILVRSTIVWAVFANLLGMVIIFTTGWIQLKIVAGYSWGAAFLAGVVPFIPTTILQIVLAAVMGSAIRRGLKTAGLLHQTSVNVKS